MSNGQSPFLTPMLIPERVGGGQARTYQLTANSVHPTRVVGRDDFGQPIEETVPIVKHRDFVTMSGCINKVPLRTAPGVNDHESLQIEQYTVTRLISQGFLPLDECPYTNDYKALVGGPLVRPKAGEEVCEGKPGGCDHLHRVMKARRDRALANWRQEEDKAAKASSEEVRKIAEAIGQAMTANQSLDLKAARQRAKETRSEE